MPPDSRFELALSMQRSGDVSRAADIYKQLLQEDPGNASALHYLGLAYMQLGDLIKADKLLEQSVRLHADDANALNDLGIVKIRRTRPEAGIGLFDRALAIDRYHLDALNNIATTLNTLRRPQEALPYLERLYRLRPYSVGALVNLGSTYLKLSDADRAIAVFRKAIRLEPQNKRGRILLGEALEAVGCLPQAKVHYMNVLRHDKNNVNALAKLLSLRGHSGQVGDQWAQSARRLLEGKHLSDDERVRLHVAMGHYYDRTGAYSDAFKNYEAGYGIQFRKAPFDSQGFTSAIDNLISTFTPNFLQSLPRQELDTERPIFILGMPRSGTTLTEQILATHSQVAAGGELTTLMSIASQITHLGSNCRPYPKGLLDLTPSNLMSMAQRYLDRLGRISQVSDRVTDKLPFNFLHLGLIALLFPRAKIIHCRRDPLDTCLSCYFVSFADELQFANNLGTLGHYYLDYARLMEHWHTVLPVPILDVEYERLVTNTEEVIRAILDYCALDWEESCLRFYETKRGIRTPSRWQVRQPIYTKAIGRWRNYEQYLEPLKTILSSLDPAQRHVGENQG